MSKPLTALATVQLMAQNMPESDQRRKIKQILRTDLNPNQTIKLLHQICDTSAPMQPVNLSISDRHQRLHYILSEFIETVEASGFQLKAQHLHPLDKSSLLIEHIEGQRQDIVEMLDGLADIVVVCFGMAVEMGYDLMPIFREVVMGSITKVNPETGRIDKNLCMDTECEFWQSRDCPDSAHRPIMDEPAGKWLKGSAYKPPQIKVLIQLPRES